MKILMFGWEYPPVKSGGLGTACYGLTKAMAQIGAQITLVVPRAKKSIYSEHLTLIDGKNIEFAEGKLKYYEVNSLLTPYINEKSYQDKYNLYKEILKGESDDDEIGAIYGRDLFHEVARFAARAAIVAQSDNFDLIVCHDWMTIDAALNAQRILHKPIALHIHATEFDRTGGHPHQLIYDIEKKGMYLADIIIANSIITKRNCVMHYGVPDEKVIPIHLGINKEDYKRKEPEWPNQSKVVLFLARMTLQKGPEYFLHAAKLALQFDPEIKFIMAGEGDFLTKMLHLAADLGIANKVFFTGHLNEKEAKEVYQMTDLFVMTSIAEPFGLTPLEAVRSGVPCIVPRTAGVSEIMSHVIKVDFWDVNELANSIVAVLKHPHLHQELINNSYQESEFFTWENTAKNTMEIYAQVLRNKEKVYA
ncbi:MAG: glycosyltransferase family 4 protein [Candidatus Margulisbacteria bacterium]|nr:glycosyltransferase family 4 protein [Candidatus Margulisiibacteriota bacterium]